MRWFMTIIFACLTYLSLIYFYGKSGTSSFENLKNYYEELKVYVSYLEEKETLLEEELASLYFSEQDLTLQARKIGYFKEGEEVIGFSFPFEEKDNLREIPISLQWKSYHLFSNSFFYIVSAFICFFIFISWDFFSKIKKELGKIKKLGPLLGSKIKPIYIRISKDFPFKNYNKKKK